MQEITSVHTLPSRNDSERPRNVAIFAPTAYGGHARYTQEFLEALAEVGQSRGIRPRLITSEDLAPEHRTSAYPIHDVLPKLIPRAAFRGKLSWAQSRLTHYQRRENRLLQWVESQRDLDLIHFQEHPPWRARGVFRAIRGRGITVVETVHNITKHRYINGIHRVIDEAVVRAARRECDALCVHTDGLVGELSAFLGPNHPPIHVTPHGVWSVSKKNGEPEKSSQGSLETLLFFGVIRENKGLHVLIKAMNSLPELKLIIAGNPESSSYMGMIHEMVDRLAPGRVEIIERFISEVEAAELFERCGLVVMPYTSFGSQSGVLHQGLAHGRPVVVSDVGALGESVRNWGIGEVVPANDEHALAKAIVSALDPQRHRRFVDACEHAREGLSWTRTAEQTINVYEMALNARHAQRTVGASL